MGHVANAEDWDMVGEGGDQEGGVDGALSDEFEAEMIAEREAHQVGKASDQQHEVNPSWEQASAHQWPAAGVRRVRPGDVGAGVGKDAPKDKNDKKRKRLQEDDDTAGEATPMHGKTKVCGDKKKTLWESDSEDRKNNKSKKRV